MWDKLVGGEKIHYTNTYLTNTGVFNLDNEKLSDVLYVCNRNQEIHNGTGYITLAFAIDGELQEQTFTTEEFEEKKVKILSRFGFLVQQIHRAEINEYLIEQYQSLISGRTYANIGFLPPSHLIKEDQICFALSKVISNENLNLKWDKQNCEFDVSFGGSIKEWQKMVKKHVVPSAKLTLALGMGLSSVIVGYLHRIGKPVDSSIFHLVGRSTTGKTTAGELAISVYGCPTKSEKGLFHSWNATANAMMRKLSKNNGVALLLDETSMSEVKDFTSIIYRVAEGRDKERSTKTGNLAEKGTWATTIITTGESSILENTNKNAGLFVRLQEFADLQWTDSAKQSNEIKSVVSKHYGGAGILYVKALSKDWGMITCSYEEWVSKLTDIIPQSDYSQRVIQRYAAILAGLELAQKPFKLKFNLDAIVELITEIEVKLNTNRNLAETVYKAILNDVPVHFNSFIYNNYYPLNDCRGKIRKHKNYYEVAYYPKAFQTLVQPFSTNLKVVEESLKNADFYLREKDRNTKRIKDQNGQRTIAYSFKVPLDVILE